MATSLPLRKQVAATLQKTVSQSVEPDTPKEKSGGPEKKGFEIR